ncbi:uncharacterized protein LOC111320215, partial [Stylophora pistillata]|uniref:uncharacterized protein LOC111320215 n=1 Tax=Stylophora pistillata TaxID=50429 RepID=UPI000C03ADF3
MDKETSKSTHETRISVEEMQATLAKTLKCLAEEIQEETTKLQTLQQEVEKNTQEFQRLFQSFLTLMRREQKEAIGLLQIGTFLEYFDLMIYVHMAVILNELFFPPTDPKTAAVLTAFAFCSTYFLRPFGALIFGYIGDNFGRRPTVIITTTIMACCCMMMANLPTYAEIGITAAITVSVLRIMQGMSSMGEIMGAKIYITEIVKPPLQYPMVESITLVSTLGAVAALGVAMLSTQIMFNWRLVFWFGVIIALVGLFARTKLRETPEYADAKIKMRRAIESTREAGLEKPAELLMSLRKIPTEKTKK